MIGTSNDIVYLSIFKNSSYVVAFLAASHFLNIIPVSTLILAILMLLDMFTGIIKSYRIHRSITSRRMRLGVMSKAVIITAPITISLVGLGIGIDMSFIAQSVVTALILSEGYSIIGNLYTARTGVVTTEFDAIAYILLNIKKILLNVMSDSDKDKETIKY